MKTRFRAGINIGVCIALGTALGFWLYFRNQHVLASYAFVKGSVVQIGAPAEGQVASVDVRVGEHVAQGAVLVQMNDTRERARVAEARAALAQTKVEVGVEREGLKVAYRKASVLEKQLKAQMSVNEAEARAANIGAKLAELQAERTTALRVKDMIPAAESDAADANSGMATENVARAQSQLALAAAELDNAGLQQATAKAKEARLALLEAAVETARAALAMAEADLTLTVVRAARSGTVSRRLVEPGAAVRVGGPLLEVWYDDDTAVEAWIDESEYGFVSPGMPAMVMLPGLEGTVFPGHVGWIGVVTDLELRNASFSIPVAKQLAQSHWIRAILLLDRADPRLLPGLTAEVSLPRGKPRAARLAPVDAPSPSRSRAGELKGSVQSSLIP